MTTTNERQSILNLIAAIHTAKASHCEDAGLSASRTKTTDGFEWDVFIGIADPGDMTIIHSKESYVNRSADDIAAMIIGCWEEDWDD